MISNETYFSEERQPGDGLSEGDLDQAEGPEEEAEGVICRWARSGHGGTDQGVVSASDQTNIWCRIWNVCLSYTLQVGKHSIIGKSFILCICLQSKFITNT